MVFPSGDPRTPVVIGGLWNGANAPPETRSGSGDALDRRTLTGITGTRAAVMEGSANGATIKISTSDGLVGTMTDVGGGSLEFTHSSSRTFIKIDSSGVTIDAPTGNVQITAAGEVDISAPTVNVSAAISTFSGVVQCDVLQATTVVATTYTPGAGNLW